MRFFILVFLLPAVSAQLARVYSWGFQGDTDPTSLSQCETVRIGQNTDGASITPPFYGFNVPLGGIPSLELFGSQTTADYQIKQPAGTQLILSFTDIFSNFGGFSPVYTIQPSSDSSCLENRQATLSVAINTTDVSTCGVVGAQISGGGQPPYTVTTVPVDSVTQTFNITLPSSDNYLSFVNTLQPGLSIEAVQLCYELISRCSGSRFVLTVRDAAGNWAETTDIITTSGQAQSCGFSSTTSDGPPTSGNTRSASAGPTGTSSPGNSGGRSSNVGAIAGGVVGGVVGLALLALLLWFLLKRRRQAKMNAYRTPGYE